jgi:hypothetical protein
MMGTQLTMEVEPGTSIEAAAEEGQQIADATNADVSFRFNSVLCICHPGGSAKVLIDEWYEVKDQTPTARSGQPF